MTLNKSHSQQKMFDLVLNCDTNLDLCGLDNVSGYAPRRFNYKPIPKRKVIALEPFEVDDHFKAVKTIITNFLRTY